MRRLASLVLASLALLPPLLLYGGPAAAQGADAQGWWWIAHRAGAPAPPAPPDVAGDDLLLQGGDVQRELNRTEAPAPTAVAALRFVVPSGALVGRLVLPVSAGARAAAVNAYRAAGAWTAAQGGALTEAPAPDLSSVATGALSPDGTSLVFTGVDRLVGDDGVLSLVLVAGPLDRVVVHHPPATALEVTPALLPVLPPYAPPPVAAGGPVPAPPPVAALPGVSAPVLASAAPGPVLAGGPAASTPLAAKRIVADDGRTRLVVLLEALLLLAFFGLLGQGPLAVLGRRTGSAPAPPAERGVGRFRQAREGAAPRL